MKVSSASNAPPVSNTKPSTPADVTQAEASKDNGKGSGIGKANGKDKDRGKDAEPMVAASPPPQPPALSPGLSMAAVYESQADRRAEELTAREAERARTRTAPTAGVSTDGSTEALRLAQDAVKNAEANRAASEKAAEARRVETERNQPEFTAEERADPFSFTAEETKQAAKPSLGFQAYQSSYQPPVESGSVLNGRA